jgi:transcriptional regulator of acetoin/glycerol metabolism
LRDPFYPVREVAGELVGVFALSQFETDIQMEAQRAPMAMQREQAQKVLDQLHRQQ